jgi:cytochrome c-type biogenesis protein
MSVMSLVSTGPLLLAIPVAAAAGAVTFLSPCCLPLVPGYLAYITGMSGADATAADATATGTAASESAAETEAGGGVTTRARAKPAAPAARRTGRTVAGTALFVAGFSAVFALTGLAVGGLGQLFSAHDSLLTRILGVVTIVLGLLFFGAFDRFMFAGRVFKPSVMPKAGLAGAPLLGVLFGIGWTPCIGPTLTAVLALSASSGTAARGAFLAFIYGLGLGIPFLIVAVAFQRVVGVLNFFKRNARMVTRVGGVLLVAVGLLEATGAWTTAITWLHTHWFNGYQLPLLRARFSAVTGTGSDSPERVSAPRVRALFHVRAWPALPAGARLRLHRGRLARCLRLGPLRGARLARRFDERGEQAGILPLLGVPVDADPEALSLHLKRLRHLAVRRPAGHRQPLTQVVGGLVVRGGHLDAGAEELAEQAVAAEDHVVRCVAGSAFPVAGQVLGERAAARDGEDVHAPADRQERDAGVEGGAHQRDLEAVPASVRLVGRLKPLLVIQGGVHVPAPGEQQAVARLGVGRHGGRRHRRDDHGGAPGAFHRAGIADRRDRGFPDPVAPASSVKLAGDADDRAAHQGPPVH